MSGEWIDVKDRKPHADERVLVRFEDGMMEVAWWNGVRTWRYGDNQPCNFVAYWQPLPEDPIPEGPFYVLKHLNGAWVLYKKGDGDCATAGLVDEAAQHLADWLNRLWRDK